MKLFEKISEKLVHLENKLVRAYDVRFSLFESKIQLFLANKCLDQKTQFEHVVMNFKKEISSLRQDLCVSSEAQQQLLEEIKELKILNYANLNALKTSNISNVVQTENDDYTFASVESEALDLRSTREKSGSYVDQAHVSNSDGHEHKTDSFNFALDQVESTALNDNHYNSKLAFQDNVGNYAFDLAQQTSVARIDEDDCIEFKNEEDSSTVDEIEYSKLDNISDTIQSASVNSRAYKDSFIENNDLTVCFDPSIKELRRENVFSTNGLDTSVNDADSAATGYQLSERQLLDKSDGIDDYDSSRKVTKTCESISTKQGFECIWCGKTFQQKSKLKVHIRIHTKEYSYECEKCCKKFIRPDSLRRHMLCVHEKLKPFVCTVCGLDLGDVDKFNMHMLQHDGGNIYTNNNNNVKENIKECEQCGCLFASDEALTRHIKAKHPIQSVTKRFRCEKCSFSSDTASDVRKHFRVHTKEKPFQCKECLRSFSKKGNMTRHLLIHSQKCPYECDKCSKKFRISSNLKRHVRLVHENFKSDVCIVCGKSFGQLNDLKWHLLTHAGKDKPCSSTTSSAVQLL